MTQGIETGEAAKKSVWTPSHHLHSLFVHLYIRPKAQLADLLESQGGDMDHGGLRSPMAEVGFVI